MKIIVVGAGIAGLYIAKRAQEAFPQAEILVLEATNKIGGRLPTEILHDEQIFDDNLPRIEPTIYEIITRKWSSSGAQKHHIYANGTEHQLRQCIAFGNEHASSVPALKYIINGTEDYIDSLLPTNVTIKYNSKVTNITRNQSDFSVTLESTAMYRAHRIYVTAPLAIFAPNPTHDSLLLTCKTKPVRVIAPTVPQWGPIRSYHSTSTGLEMFIEPNEYTNFSLMQILKNTLDLDVAVYEIEATPVTFTYSNGKRASMEGIYLFGDSYDSNPGWISNILKTIDEHFM